MPAGPNLASGTNCSGGFCYAPENPVVTTMSTDKKYYLAVYVLSLLFGSRLGLMHGGRACVLRIGTCVLRIGACVLCIRACGHFPTCLGGGCQPQRVADFQFPRLPDPLPQNRYDALHAGDDQIGLSFSADGVTWQYSSLLAVQTADNSPCGRIRTPLGLVPEPNRCKGCYSVLWTGQAANSFRPVCHAIIRNINE
jgi:hypothetical protein